MNPFDLTTLITMTPEEMTKEIRTLKEKVAEQDSQILELKKFLKAVRAALPEDTQERVAYYYVNPHMIDEPVQKHN